MALSSASVSSSTSGPGSSAIETVRAKVREIFADTANATENLIHGKIECKLMCPFNSIISTLDFEYVWTAFLKNESEREIDNLIGVGIDWDEESECDSDDEIHSEDEIERRAILKLNYDIDTMYEIVCRRDFNQWNLSSISHRYRQIVNSSTGRSQISR